MKFKGYLLAALAAATYGTNPAFAVPLYSAGMNATSVLFFRYLSGLVFLALLALVRGRKVTVSRVKLAPVAILGILMALSSLTLFESYNYMNSGVASTLLFVYPLFVAIIMTLVYHERFRAATAICLALMLPGLVLLMSDGSGFALDAFGTLLVMVSSVSYSVYLVMVSVSRRLNSIPTVTLLFQVLLFGLLLFVFVFALGTPLTMPTEPWMWLNIAALGLLPTVISLVCTTVAIQKIGSTATALFGALEPVTAVVLSVTVLGQNFTTRDIIGSLLIVAGTTLIVASDSVDVALLRVRRLFPSKRRGH